MGYYLDLSHLDFIVIKGRSTQQEAFEQDPSLKARWHPEFGDKQSEIVWIGIDLEKDEIIESLDACLLTDEEMHLDWTTFVDPLPKFVVKQL